MSLPIKIEFFHVPINKSISNKKLGYLLLKLNDAQTINPNPTYKENITNESYKLIGSKSGSYKINLSLRIENFSYNANDKPTEIIENSKPKNESDLKKVEENVETVLPKSVVNDLSDQIESLPENNNSLKMFACLQQKLINELEDWKDKQKILFIEMIKTKKEKLLKDLEDKWSDEKEHTEEKLTHAMTKCKELANDLEKKADMLKEKDVIVTAKQLDLTCREDRMDNKYIGLVQSLSFNAQTINELNSKISDLESKLHESEKLNILLRKENEELKCDINTNTCSLQVQAFEKKISNLEYKIEEANKSCKFYTEQWIASVRKINQMYVKFHETKANENLLNNKPKYLNNYNIS